MDVTSEVIELGVRLAESAARNTATAVADKVRTLRASAKKDEAISGLEEIINNLIADKSELTRIAQSYQAELVSQRLNAGDVKYITDTVFPLLEDLVDQMPGDQGETMRKSLTALKPLLSIETANVLQLLGFDFRRAFGIPLTKLAETAILKRANHSEQLQLAATEREKLYIQLALDPAAFERFQRLFGAKDQ
ncbi:hypothetical protein [Leifsonia soli]|uniref:Uncharacterized protein n=1 Tax=Leifsonia soli TaxID=582665 RepID=A0A852T4E7_9MICO|nr:hypothetical protein [Leifsonia soli]NYD76057.1 hypothetical protein [Leifsonia soli]